MPSRSRDKRGVPVPTIKWMESLAHRVVQAVAPDLFPLTFKQACGITAVSQDHISCGQHAIVRSEGVCSVALLRIYS
jgi:hypothetical protein